MSCECGPKPKRPPEELRALYNAPLVPFFEHSVFSVMRALLLPSGLGLVVLAQQLPGLSRSTGHPINHHQQVPGGSHVRCTSPSHSRVMPALLGERIPVGLANHDSAQLPGEPYLRLENCLTVVPLCILAWHGGVGGQDVQGARPPRGTLSA